MAETVAAWPRKTRELHNHHFDSTVWNDFGSATTTS
jgi:aryl sulfotransferase